MEEEPDKKEKRKTINITTVQNKVRYPTSFLITLSTRMQFSQNTEDHTREGVQRTKQLNKCRSELMT